MNWKMCKSRQHFSHCSETIFSTNMTMSFTNTLFWYWWIQGHNAFDRSQAVLLAQSGFSLKISAKLPDITSWRMMWRLEWKKVSSDWGKGVTKRGCSWLLKIQGQQRSSDKKNIWPLTTNDHHVWVADKRECGLFRSCSKKWLILTNIDKTGTRSKKAGDAIVNVVA